MRGKRKAQKPDPSKELPSHIKNERFHTQAENNAARHRCRQLIEGGANAVDWLVDLYGQK